jgi:serine/threonine protein kinase/predicted Zn-dependent protease
MAIKCPKCHFENPDDILYCGKCAALLPTSKEPKVSVTKTLETPQEELTRGTTLAGRYEILEELGRGGMGNVYRVVDKKINEEVALKLLKPEIASDRKTLERFSNELKLARKIVHKNVGRMYHLSEEGGTHFITMEYVPGQDLKGLIRQSGQLAVGTTISIAKQICEGLSEAHRLGVVHRDLKPSNIMIDKDGSARIMDFGIARSLKGKGITGAGVIIGTPEYMSPEQVEGKELDQRSDLYSLGIILYEMVTGRVPFEGDTPLSIAVRHKTESPPDPKELNAQTPDDLSRMIHKCMEKNKETRYQSAGEVLAELDKIEKGIPSTERRIPRKRPITSREITVTFGLKKLLIPALIVVALVIIGVIIWRPWSRKAAIPIPSGKPSIAVMYFENNTGDERLDHWRKALSDLLIADLSQSKYLTVLPGESLFNILKNMNQLEAKSYSLEDLKEVAAKSRVKNILVGKYAKAGDTFRINAMLQNPATGEVIGSEMIEGKGEESLFSMVDELTKKVKVNFKLTAKEIVGDLDKNVGQITTSSPEAYKYYNEGRESHLKGEYHQSIPFYVQATAIDPEFAMAYRGMSTAYNALHLSSKSDQYLRKALEFSHRVSERERLWIQAEYYRSSATTHEKAIEAYNKLLDIYPDAESARYNLASLFRSTEQWDKAVEQFEAATKNDPTFWTPFVGLAFTYMAMGSYDKAGETLEYSQDAFPNNAIVLWYSAVNYLCQGQNDLALLDAEKAHSVDPSAFKFDWVTGDIHLCQGDLVTAEKEYLKLFERTQQVAHLWARRKLGHLRILQGRFKDAKEQFKEGMVLARKLNEEGWEASFSINIIYAHLKSGLSGQALEESLMGKSADLWNKGMIYLELNKTAEARGAAEALKEEIEKGVNKKRIRYYYHLMGMIELKSRNFHNAIEYLMKAVSLLPAQRHLIDSHASFIDPLASAYYKSGDLEKARKEYEKITTLTAGRVYYGDIYAKSFYMLGKIYEQQGNKGKAIEHYEKFLNLWKDADPGIAEVEDAKKRLAGLKSQ